MSASLSTCRQQSNLQLPQFSEKSAARLVREGSPSIKTTIPENVVKLLELSNGDSIIWKIDVQTGGVVVTVEKGPPNSGKKSD